MILRMKWHDNSALRLSGYSHIIEPAIIGTVLNHGDGSYVGIVPVKGGPFVLNEFFLQGIGFVGVALFILSYLGSGTNVEISFYIKMEI